KLRFTEAQAEIAAGREDWDAVIDVTSSTIEQAQAHMRGKYEALGLATRARALHAKGKTREALNDLARAAALAKATGDPALELRILAAGLAIEPVEADAARAGELVSAIEREIANTPIAARFAASDPVALVRKLALS